MNTRTSRTHKETVIAAGREYVCELHAASGGYVIICPQMRPVVGAGPTPEQARGSIREKIEAWIEYADCREVH